MANLIGQSLGRYNILEQLGEGGMATVYKARDMNLNRDVAVKIIRTDIFGPAILQRLLERFKREGQALAKLTHPNIVTVLEYGEHEGAPYLVMPYFPGGTLKSRAKKPIPYQDAVRLLIPIAQALAHAHEQGIIHRDVKPANILITSTGEPMLSDFGIAKLLEDQETRELTGTGVGIGTPEYMAPEQGMGQADERADIYALGIVFYELVTGQIPYRADTPMAMLIKKREEPLPRPKLFVPSLPDSVEHVLTKALAHDPQNRYQTAREFAGILERLSHGEIITTAPASNSRLQSRSSNAIVTNIFKGKNKWGLIAAVIAALALFTTVFGLQYSGGIAALMPKQTPTLVVTVPPSLTLTDTPLPTNTLILPTITDMPSTFTPTISPTPEFVDCVYNIQSGDSIYGISARFGVAADKIKDVNGANLINPNALTLGENLLILSASTSTCLAQNGVPKQGAFPIAQISTATYSFNVEPTATGGAPIASATMPPPIYIEPTSYVPPTSTPIPFVMPTVIFTLLRNGDNQSLMRDLKCRVNDIPNVVVYHWELYQDGGLLKTLESDNSWSCLFEFNSMGAVPGNLYIYARAQINVSGQLMWTPDTPVTITLVE